jgi:peptide/nickel transport system permease protein
VTSVPDIAASGRASRGPWGIRPAPGPRRGARRPLLSARRVAIISGGTLAFVTAFAAVAPWLAPHDPLIPTGVPYQPPLSDGALLGTDQVGRDLLSRVLEGMSVSWLSALALVVVVGIVGTAVGLAAGFLGGVVDRVLMAVVDLFLALPAAILAIVIAAVLGPSLMHALIAIGVLSWPYYARLVRAEVRALMSRPFLEAARLSGNGRLRLMVRHILPGAWPILLVTLTLDLGGTVVVLAGLSFLGLGRAAPSPELGAMTAQGMSYLLTNWWIPVIPAICVTVLALVANLAGDGLRAILKDQ